MDVGLNVKCVIFVQF